MFAAHEYGGIGSLAAGNSLSILNGSGVEIVEVDCGVGCLFKGIKFNQAGKASVRVAVVNPETGASGEKVFSFTVSERPADKPVTIHHDFPSTIRLKVGDSAEELKRCTVCFENLNYGVVTGCRIEWLGNYVFEQLGGKGGYGYVVVDDQRTFDAKNYLPDFSEYLYAGRPGTLTLQPFYNKTNLDVPICITVEEPIITDNAPNQVRAGDSIRLETALTNTSLKNLKVSGYTDGGFNQKYYDEENIVFYKPSVTILEGGDCLKRSQGDYSNTLTSSETLTFQKAGTIRLKLAYSNMNYDYSCEKTVTIRIIDDGNAEQSTDNSTTSVTDKPTDNGSDTVTSSVEEQPVVMTDEETGIQIGAKEGVLPADTTLVVTPSHFVLADAAGKYAAFDISLENSGAKIQPNGKVQVTMPIPADYDRERLTIYYVAEDGTKTELPCSVSGDTITFETDHFSLYVLAEKTADATASTPEKTGNSPWLWIALGVVLVAVAGGGFALWWFKIRKTA